MCHQREKTEGIQDEYPDVGFREVDIRRDLETAEEYGVRETPTTLVYDGDELEGAIETAEHGQSGFATRLLDYVRG